MSAPEGWRDAIRQVHTEAGGMLSVNIVEPSRAHGLMAASLAGDENATRLMRALVLAIEAVHRAPRKRPVLCLCCPRAVRPRDQFTVCVTRPENGNPSMVIGSAICARYFADKSTLIERVATALKEIWPQARLVGHIHEAPERVQ
jgi:hypothetical protein